MFFSLLLVTLKAISKYLVFVISHNMYRGFVIIGIVWSLCVCVYLQHSQHSVQLILSECYMSRDFSQHVDGL